MVDLAPPSAAQNTATNILIGQLELTDQVVSDVDLFRLLIRIKDMVAGEVLDATRVRNAIFGRFFKTSFIPADKADWKFFIDPKREAGLGLIDKETNVLSRTDVRNLLYSIGKYLYDHKLQDKILRSTTLEQSKKDSFEKYLTQFHTYQPTFLKTELQVLVENTSSL